MAIRSLKNGTFSRSLLVGNSAYDPFVPYQTNLQAWYDAAKTTSYPGTGSTWYDLTANANNLTIQGTSSWSGGVFDWTASGAYGSKSSPTNIPFGSTQYTFIIWTKYSSSRNGQALIGTGTGSTNNTHNTFRWGSSSSQLVNYWYGNDYTQGVTTSSNTWYQLACGWDGSTRYVYINNTLQGTNSASGKNTANSNLFIGASNLDSTIQSYVSVALVYNAWIGGTEITNNFNAFKSRYGY
jgi:hypothetical protein